jgi:YidC/Oxa1 family membrane protein insertase
MNIFNLLLIEPMYNLLLFFSSILPGASLGLSIIALTLLVKGALFPLTFKSLKAGREMRELQPKIKEVREQYKDDKEKMAQELMKIYQEHKVNPLGSCLPIIIQLPIFLALFRVLQFDFSSVNESLHYGLVAVPESINEFFLGFDLGEVSIPLAIAAALAQYVQVTQTMPTPPAKEAKDSSGALDEDVAANMQKMMKFLIPGMTLLIGSTSLPAGIMLYWLTTTVLTVILYKIFLPKK